MGSDRTSSVTVSSVVEHQTDNLAVAGSTPVPHRLTTDTTNRLQDLLNTLPKGGEHLLDWPATWFAALMAAWEDSLQDVIPPRRLFGYGA